MSRRNVTSLRPLAWLLASGVLAAFAYEGPKVSAQAWTPRAHTRVSPYTESAMPQSATPGDEAGAASARKEGYLPNIVLTTQENERVRFYDDLVKGKVVLINFMFTTCSGICPLTTAK